MRREMSSATIERTTIPTRLTCEALVEAFERASF